MVYPIYPLCHASERSATCTFPEATGSYPKAAQRGWPSVCQWIGDCPDSCGCHVPRCMSDPATHVFRELCLVFSYLGNPFFELWYCDCSFFASIFQLEGMFDMQNSDWQGMKYVEQVRSTVLLMWVHQICWCEASRNELHMCSCHFVSSLYTQTKYTYVLDVHLLQV